MNNYIKHANREFDVLGWPGDCDMQTMICNQLVELLKVFADHGHSGSSAPYTVNLFKKLAMFEPISPLTGEDSEWNDISEQRGKGCWQNNRCSRVFKDANGRAYDIEARIFIDANGSSWSSKGSRQYIKFPYTPKTRYIKRQKVRRIYNWIKNLIERKQDEDCID